MAFVFGDTFDTYGAADLAKRYVPLGGATFGIDVQLIPCPTTIPLPPGGGSVMCCTTTRFAARPVASAQTYIACGWWYCSANPATNSMIIVFYDPSGSEHVSVRGNGGGKLTVTRAGTVISTSTNSITVGWHHIGLVAKIDDSTGTYDLYVDGTTTGWCSGTGADTRNGGSALVGSIAFGWSGATYWKHVLILDTSGSVSNAWPGMVVGSALRPVGVGAHAAWTSNSGTNFGAVGEVTADADQTFVQSSTPDQIDTHVMSDLPASSATIIGVQHCLMARQDAGTARTIAPVDRIGGTDHVGASVNLAGSYIDYLIPETTSPATSAAWDLAEVNAMEAGYKEIA